MWQYKTDPTDPTKLGDGVTNTDKVKLKVFGVEMVLIPEGGFYLGSGGTESGSFTDGSWVINATIPFLISSEDPLTIDSTPGTPGTLWGTVAGTGDNGIGNALIYGPVTLADVYPKGYGAFYMMKYELSQGQYRDFLNTLTRAQQNNG